jgi:chromate reductase
VFLDLRPLNKSEVFANAFSGSFDPDGNLIDDKLRQLIANLMGVLATRVRPSS